MSPGIVLVVSDERETRTLLAQALSFHNGPVLVADGGAQAIAVLSEHSVAVMILDHLLCQVQDVMLCARQTQVNVSIIGFLASGDDRVSNDLTTLDMDDYLVAPPSPDRVRLAVAHALKNCRLKHEVEWLVLANRIGCQIACNLNTKQLSSEVVRLVWESFDYYYVGIALLEGDAVEVMAAVRGEPGCQPPVRVCHRLPDSQEMLAHVLRQGEPLLVTDLQDRSPYSLPPELSKARSALVVPLVLQERPLGALAVLSANLCAFEPRDVPLFESLAAQIAVFLHNARLLETQQKHEETLHSLNAAALAMQSVITSQRQVLEVMAAELSRSGFVSLVHLLDLTSDSMGLSWASLSPRLAKALGGLPDTLPESWSLDMARAPIYRRVLDERRAVFLLDIETLVDEIVPAALPNDKRASIVRTLGNNPHALVAPMLLGDQVEGCLTVFSSRLDAEDCPAFMIFANHVGVALSNARLLADTRHAVELVLLNEAGQAMAATLESDEVLQLLLQAVAKVVQGGNCVVALWDDVEQRHVPRARLSQGRVLLANSSNGDAKTLDPLPVLHVPLIGHNRTLGLLALDRKYDGSELSAEDVQLAQALANQAASALENTQLYAKLIRSAEELEHSQRRLIQSEKLAATGRLAASIAHEINNPLQAIKSCLELILDEAQEGKSLDRTYLDVAASELERIRSVIQQMLDLYRPSQERMIPVDINASVEGVLALMRQQLEGHHIVVETHLDGTTPYVIGRGDQIRQVLINLILNAGEAMPAGGQLALQTHKDSDSFVTIQVIDNGVGIAPENLTRIADPFFTTKSKGVGLGLTICHEIIERHQGTLDVTSQVGHGSTFTIRLPAAE